MRTKSEIDLFQPEKALRLKKVKAKRRREVAAKVKRINKRSFIK